MFIVYYFVLEFVRCNAALLAGKNVRGFGANQNRGVIHSAQQCKSMAAQKLERVTAILECCRVEEALKCGSAGHSARFSEAT